MKTYSILHPFWMSFYSKNLYAVIIKNWKGRSFLYLLLLSIILTVSVTVQVKNWTKEMVKDLPEVVKQIPELRIVGGVVTTPQSRPYYIKEIPSGKLLAIIDTSGRHMSLQNSEAKILLTRTKIMYRPNANEIREYNIAGINNLTVTNNEINGWINTVNSWLAILLAPFILIGVYLYKIIAALLYSLVAMIIAALVKIKAPYSSKLSLAIVAMTPSSLMLAVFELFSVKVPFEFLFSLIVTTGFIAFGLISNKSELV